MIAFIFSSALVLNFAYTFLQHLASKGHVAIARDPATFACIDAMEARHQEILVERAINEEVNHHLLKLLMLKHPEKFAELDWIFPKLARWVALLRQAEKNVAERHRLAAEAAEAAAVSSPDKELKPNSTANESDLLDSPLAASSLPSSSSFVALETNAIMCGDEHTSCLSPNSNTASKRSFDQTLSSTGALSNIASQSPDLLSSDCINRYSNSCAVGVSLSDALPTSFASSLDSSSLFDSRALSKPVSPSGFCGSTENPSAGIPTEDPNCIAGSLTNTLASDCDTVFAKPAARANQTTATDSFQFEKTSFSSSILLSMDPSAPFLANPRVSLSATRQVGAGVILPQVSDSAATMSIFSASEGPISNSISQIGM